MRVSRVVGWLFVVLIVLLAIGITATIGWRPIIGPKARALTDRKFEATPERLARGDYLVNNLNGCFDCHADHDWTKDDSPIVEGTKGGGQPVFPLKDLPGQVYPPNISPDKEFGAGSWTDDQLARAIREGIGNDGRALFNFMPYENFRSMSDEDLASVIVYLRSLPPVHRAVPKTELVFPVKYLIRSVPQPLVEPVPPPDVSTPVKRGQYLVTLGGCRDCHTAQDSQGQKLTALDLGGGFLLRGPWPDVASQNLTQDPSGIPYYDETLFLEVIRTGHVKARRLSQIMPWWTYRGLKDEDLKAIFAYLKTVPPVKHRVDNSKPVTQCKVCGLVHPGGEDN